MFSEITTKLTDLLPFIFSMPPTELASLTIKYVPSKLVCLDHYGPKGRTSESSRPLPPFTGKKREVKNCLR